MLLQYKIAHKIQQKYGNRFELYYVGSYARDEEYINDYDIAIYDNNENINDWNTVLAFFDNVLQDGKRLDVQIDMSIKKKIAMSGRELYNNRNKPIRRYFYRDGELLHKDTIFVTEKQRRKGLDRVKHANIRII